MGVVYAHYNYNDHALNCHQKALSFDPQFMYTKDILLRIGLLHRQLGNYDSALQYLEKAHKDPPNGLLPEDISLQIGFTYQVMGDDPTAVSIYRELYHLYPTALQLIIQYAWFLFLRSKSNENLETVLRIVNQGLAVHRCEPTLLLIAGRIAMKQDDMAMAYQQYRYCISYCNDNPFFWCGLGVLYYKNDQEQDAVIAFQRALYLQSEMSEAW
jgi:tetratricopeptide (TPR) repeat protein